MTDFDEISRAIGRMEGKLETIERTQRHQHEQLEKIENALSDHRIKVAGLAGVISGGITAVYHLFKGLR